MNHLPSFHWHVLQVYLFEKVEKCLCGVPSLLLKKVKVGPTENESLNYCYYGFIERIRVNHTQVPQSAILENPHPPIQQVWPLPICENLYTPPERAVNN